ncbi:XPG domain-containing protein [Plectosphaerella cucumerina]|uniref:XPG domain-containing protein n=1 Tax=Plectosphaerella cucumerina TaxID=40658 RepID=A0A8K0X4Q6_9PEZI|nr:XPG domain-containing protein [Plectosphaerella cucumerina]
MPALVEDDWINGQANSQTSVTDLEDCSIAIDATYYLQLMLDTPPSREPLLSALGGLTGLETHIREDLEQWEAHKIIPFFIFDGQDLHGQPDVSIKRGKNANRKADEGWTLYRKGQAESAVAAFGDNAGAFRVQDLYHVLQKVLRSKELHFLVAPYNAAAQIAYLDMIDSDQCAGIMGSQELLLYPINDGVIKSINWESKTVTAIFKKSLIRSLNVSESTFIDALLMTGTSFLSPFPPLLDDQSVRRQPYTINDALNMLRTADKSVGQSCSAFGDILAAQDPDWLDRYRRARMAVSHFTYIAEDGEVKVHDWDTLTKDNLQYLGLQLPAELYHYLNTGLIGGRLLSGITHRQLVVLPTLDGTVTEEYKKLVTSQLTPIREQALALLIPRMNRWIGRQDVTLKAWFDPKFSQKLNYAAVQPNPLGCAFSWDVKKEHFGKSDYKKQSPGTIAFEVLSLLFSSFSDETIAKSKRVKGIDSAEEIISLTLWRFLHLRGYVTSTHGLTDWGNALAISLLHASDSCKEDANSQHAFEIYEAVLLAFELLRFGVLDGTSTEQSNGVANGGGDDQASATLIGRCASLLTLGHQANGYTGPLSRDLLYFRSLVSAVREVDRDLIEAIVASTFLHAQSKRDRTDYFAISQKLPFLYTPDIALGIAVSTFLGSLSPSDDAETRKTKLDEFPGQYVPNSTNFSEDLNRSLNFFDSLCKGVEQLAPHQLSSEAKAAWRAARFFREDRRV